VEEEIEEKEKEDVVKNMEKKHSEALKHKRSFFVRMVSDPKLYNPKIVKMDRRQKLFNMGVTSDCTDLSPRHSWVSWPLAVLLQGAEIDEVSMRSVKLLSGQIHRSMNLIHLQQTFHHL